MMRSSAASVAVTAAAAAAVAAIAAKHARRHFASASVVLPRSLEAQVSRRRPGNVGDSLHSLETPCLVVDLDAMEKNLAALPKSLQSTPKVAIRPHAKAHKSSAIGRVQMRLSRAAGLCCQKVGEAEAMFAGGVTDLLLSNEVFGTDRFERMAVLAKAGANVTLVFDNADSVAQASLIATTLGIVFRALVDVNVGQNRCGVDSIEEAVALARRISTSSGLELRGIQAYHGAAQHIRDYSEKEGVIRSVASKARQVRDAFVKEGLICDVVTGGGTGTYLFEAASGVFTEVQPGSYLFNDADYARNLDKSGHLVRQWEQSLFVLTTVMSTNASAPRAVVDAGMKAVSLDSGPPLVYSSIDPNALPPLEYQPGGDEHGILVPTTESEIPMPSLGQKLLLTPGHCDPTVNMYDFIVGYRNGIVEHVWPVEARGPGN